MMSTMMPILSRSWHGPLYRLKYQLNPSRPASQPGPRHEGVPDTDGSHLVCFAGPGEHWFGEGSVQPGLPPENLRHGRSGRSRRRGLIGCSEALSPARACLVVGDWV